MSLLNKINDQLEFVVNELLALRLLNANILDHVKLRSRLALPNDADKLAEGFDNVVTLAMLIARNLKPDEEQLPERKRRLNQKYGQDTNISVSQCPIVNLDMEKPVLNFAACGSGYSQGVKVSNENSLETKQQDANLFTSQEYCCTALFDINLKDERSSIHDEVRDLLAEGQHREAILFCEETIHEMRQTMGMQLSDIRVAHVLNSMTLVYRETQKYEQVIWILTDVLEIRKREYGDNDMRVATTLNHLAVYHDLIGKHSEALHFSLNALKIKIKRLESDHPRIAKEYYNLGVFNQKIGEYIAAEGFYQKALNINKVRFGFGSPAMNMVHRNLVTCYAKQGKLDAAIQLMLSYVDLRNNRELPPVSADFKLNLDF